MAQAIYRPSWAEIDLDHIMYNIKQMKEKLTPSSKIIAVVKADAYGHGAVEVAKAALKAGAEGVAVALLEEAIALRDARIDVPILVLGRVFPEHAPIALERDITLTVFQIEWIQAAEQHLLAAEATGKLSIHLELDTGMNRTGIRTAKALADCIDALNNCERIYLTGVYTHFATADEADTTYYVQQTERFDALKEQVKALWSDPVAYHISNSAAAIQYTKDAQDYIRFGVAMYGLHPSPYVAETEAISLKPAFSLHSKLVEVKQLPAGERISYGGTYTTSDTEFIGTVPIGYADGWVRKLQGADVLVDGKRMPIVGRICMDQFMIRLDKAYEIGQQVTLIGKQGEAEITMQEIAARLETIVYEIPCIIGSRIPRIYK